MADFVASMRPSRFGWREDGSEKRIVRSEHYDRSDNMCVGESGVVGIKQVEEALTLRRTE
jgi:hypothetical protein